jgi:hypothetical protein
MGLRAAIRSRTTGRPERVAAKRERSREKMGKFSSSASRRLKKGGKSAQKIRSATTGRQVTSPAKSPRKK